MNPKIGLLLYPLIVLVVYGVIILKILKRKK